MHRSLLCNGADQPLAAPAFRRVLFLVVAVGMLSCLPGCTDNQSANVVSGSVTLGADPVGGEIFFMGPDNKTEVKVLIIDGKYVLPNPPQGKCKIKIIGEPKIVGGEGKDAAKAQPDTSKLTKDGPATATKGKAPPAKYASYDTSGLSFEVKSGRQDNPIKLEQQ